MGETEAETDERVAGQPGKEPPHRAGLVGRENLQGATARHCPFCAAHDGFHESSCGHIDVPVSSLAWVWISEEVVEALVNFGSSRPASVAFHVGHKASVDGVAVRVPEPAWVTRARNFDVFRARSVVSQ